MIRWAVSTFTSRTTLQHEQTAQLVVNHVAFTSLGALLERQVAFPPKLLQRKLGEY